jgi:hypothetical protein
MRTHQNRVAVDRDLARRLYDSLSALTIEETGQKLRVYLDQTRLEDGQRWDSGFMEGLSRSWVFVPIVSVGSVQPMMGLADGEDWCDNVLLEWTAALELHQRGIVKAVLPVIQGSFFSDAQAAFGGVPGLPAHASAATMEQVVTHLKDITDDGSTEGLRELVQQASGQPEPTIQGVVNSLLKFQGIKVVESGSEDRFLLLACDGIFDVFSNEDVVRFIEGQLDLGVKLDNVVWNLVDKAVFELGSQDNCTVVLVDLASPCPPRPVRRGSRK